MTRAQLQLAAETLGVKFEINPRYSEQSYYNYETNKRKVYGEYATMEEAENAQRNINHIIRRSCTIQLWEEEK